MSVPGSMSSGGRNQAMRCSGVFDVSPSITGGAIVGEDFATSVTNSYGQIWDEPNRFVTGAALYPQNPGRIRRGPLPPSPTAPGTRSGILSTADLMEAPSA
jgi:hypothetical protein